MSCGSSKMYGPADEGGTANRKQGKSRSARSCCCRRNGTEHDEQERELAATEAEYRKNPPVTHDQNRDIAESRSETEAKQK
jgi:hypothetical protein